MGDWKVSKWLQWFVGAQYPYHYRGGGLSEMYIPENVYYSAYHLYMMTKARGE